MRGKSWLKAGLMTMPGALGVSAGMAAIMHLLRKTLRRSLPVKPRFSRLMGGGGKKRLPPEVASLPLLRGRN
jgi:hypothetical protein